MTFEEICNEWTSDAKFDLTKLPEESERNLRLHAKYLVEYMKEKLKFNTLKKEFAELERDKYTFYHDGPSQETEKKGWKLPDRGVPMKNQVDRYLKTDPDITIFNLRIVNQQDKVNLLKDILEAIKSRGFGIRNAIEAKRFLAGD